MKNTTTSTNRSLRRCVLLLAMAIPAGYGCTTTSGSGAATPVAYTTTGTSATLGQPIDQVDAKTKAVLANNGVVIEDRSSDKGGDHREYKGKANGLDVSVTLERKGEQATKVEVTAKKNLVEYNKDFAKKINDQIAT